MLVLTTDQILTLILWLRTILYPSEIINHQCGRSIPFANQVSSSQNVYHLPTACMIYGAITHITCEIRMHILYMQST